MAIAGGLIVDADAHVLEPRDTWLRYLEPRRRHQAIRIETDADGLEMLLIDNKSHKRVHGILGGLGGVGMGEEAAELLTRGRRTYEDGCPPGGYDPAARLKVMDEERIDVALLYPTLGILWEGHVQDPALATAFTRAYNRYLVDFCAHDRKRLVPVAHVNLLDPQLAIAEATRARRDGCVGIYLSPDPEARGGRRLDDPALARFWDAASDLEMPVGFHVVARETHPMSDYIAPGRDALARNTDQAFYSTFLGLEVMAAFTQMLVTGVLETHPRLKVAVLETGSNWLGAWLDRMDHKYEKTTAGREVVLKMKPSAYFDRQCVISADPDETMTDLMVERFGDDKVIWASDYPHIDADLGVLRELEAALAGLPQASRAKVLGDNCLRFYGMDA
jgi:predicted TIM-barrel fold metal-dependent hydrolase